MSRNLENERKWLNNNYKRIEVRVKKEDGEKFVQLLKSQGISVNSWGNEQIKKYLKKYEKNT